MSLRTQNSETIATPSKVAATDWKPAMTPEALCPAQQKRIRRHVRSCYSGVSQTRRAELAAESEPGEGRTRRTVHQAEPLRHNGDPPRLNRHEASDARQDKTPWQSSRNMHRGPTVPTVW